jgi:hypothetical protein
MMTHVEGTAAHFTQEQPAPPGFWKRLHARMTERAKENVQCEADQHRRAGKRHERHDSSHETAKTEYLEGAEHKQADRIHRLMRVMSCVNQAEDPRMMREADPARFSQRQAVLQAAKQQNEA